MILAVASGKGGTGKTVIATSLARALAARGRRVVYADADAEEPNGAIVLAPRLESRRRYTVTVPRLAEERCAGHGACQRACAFNAILATKGTIVVFDELCHSCGACARACPDGALVERPREIGTITTGRAQPAAAGEEAGRGARIEFIEGRLDVGEARVTPLIEGVREAARPDGGVAVIDCPPGTSCSAMAGVRGADLALLVAEPTPFGLHDLELAAGMARALGVPTVAVINRADLGDHRVRALLDEKRIDVVAEIDYSRSLAEAYADARPLLEADDGFAAAIAAVADEVERRGGAS